MKYIIMFLKGFIPVLIVLNVLERLDGSQGFSILIPAVIALVSFILDLTLFKRGDKSEKKED